MEELTKRYTACEQALITLQESLLLYDNNNYQAVHEQIRDSVIKRFEYSMDTFWKYLKEYLQKKHAPALTVISPKAIFRASLLAGIIDEAEFSSLSDMVEDRNLTSHTYNELLADVISKKAREYHTTMTNIIKRIAD